MVVSLDRLGDRRPIGRVHPEREKLEQEEGRISELLNSRSRSTTISLRAVSRSRGSPRTALCRRGPRPAVVPSHDRGSPFHEGRAVKTTGMLGNPLRAAGVTGGFCAGELTSSVPCGKLSERCGHRTPNRSPCQWRDLRRAMPQKRVLPTQALARLQELAKTWS